MASTWITKRPRKSGFSFRVMYRLGGHETAPRSGGAFSTKREATIRKAWIDGRLAAMQVPDFSVLAAPVTAPTLREKAWQRSRGDVRGSTVIQHRTALGRVLPVLGARPYDSITPEDVQDLVDKLAAEGKARETIRKSKTALAMVFKLVEGAQKSWRRLDGHNQLPKLVLGVTFNDGIEVIAKPTDRQPTTAAA